MDDYGCPLLVFWLMFGRCHNALFQGKRVGKAIIDISGNKDRAQ